MKEDYGDKNSFLDPKFTSLKMAQVFCNAANEHLDKLESSNAPKDTPIIFTHSYIITGEIIPFSTIKSDNKNLSLKNAKLIFEFTKNFVEENFSEKEMIKNPSKILLIKDAQIKSLSSNQTTTLPVFFLFADQIVGFSFGHLD